MKIDLKVYNRSDTVNIRLVSHLIREQKDYRSREVSVLLEHHPGKEFRM